MKTDTIGLIIATVFIFVLGLGSGYVIGYKVGYKDGLNTPASVTSQAHAREDEAEAVIRHRIELLLTTQSIIMCESGGKHDGVWGDSNLKYPVYGIGQFQERTFYWLAKQAGFKKVSWKKVDDQLRLLLWAVDNGYAGLWTCYRRV